MRNAADSSIHALCQADDIDAAATLALNTYGREIMGFLVNRARDHLVASDAFAVFAEDLWKGLPKFQFRSSVRSWLYAIAHHALVRIEKKRTRDRRHLISLDETSQVFQVAERIRTETKGYLRTEAKERFRKLREVLDERDRLLLELRISQRFSWTDIARITLDPDTPRDEQSLQREAARLRKRFQLVKEHLRTLVNQELESRT